MRQLIILNNGLPEWWKSDRLYIIGDCLEYLPKIPGHRVDLIIADPPFNIGKNYGVSDNRLDYYEWCDKWISECFRILSPHGSIYIMTITKHLPMLLHIMSDIGDFINLIAWRNVSANHSLTGFWESYQPIMYYAKNIKHLKFNRYAQKRKIFKKNLRWGGYSTEPKGQLLDYWDDIPFIYAGSIFHKEAIIEPNTNKKAHPCQMPIQLAKRMILFSTDEGDTVLDPFLGSGTTIRACRETNRIGLGFEISNKFEWVIKEQIMEETPYLESYLGVD